MVGHDVRTVHQESWAGLKNGALLTQAEDAGFSVLGLMHTYADILIPAEPILQLDAFAPQLFTALDITDFEERESSNYVDGHYYKSNRDGLEVHVCYTDQAGLETYRFWVHLSAEVPNSAPDIARRFANVLAAKGWSCFIPAADWGKTSWKGEGTRYEA